MTSDKTSQDKTQRKRRPRGQRVAPGERPPMVLTARDREIIQAVNDYQLLLGGQIEALFFTSRSTAQYRLSRLYHNEFLDRHFMTVVSGGPAASPILYTLGQRGQEVLLQEFQYEPEHIRRFPKTLAWRFVDHRIQINEVRVAVSLACQIKGFRLETWLDETVFRAKPEYVSLPDKHGKAAQKPVYPDAYFRLTVPQGQAHFFLELDRATEQRSKFRPQVEVYEAYTRSGLYERRFHTRSLRILIVTTTPQRLKNLKEVTRTAGGDRKYWFTTFDRIRPDTVLTEAIWERIESGESMPLIA